MRPRACPADEQVQVVKQEKAVEEDDINGTEDKGLLDVDSFNRQDEA